MNIQIKLHHGTKYNITHLVTLIRNLKTGTKYVVLAYKRTELPKIQRQQQLIIINMSHHSHIVFTKILNN